jgi:hypothetical protein
MKSVPNLISYHHEFFQNFYQSLAICFELFSFGVIFNSEIADEWAPPVRRRAPCRCRGLKLLSGPRVPTAGLARAAASRSSPAVRAVASPHARRPDRTLTRSEAASPVRS